MQSCLSSRPPPPPAPVTSTSSTKKRRRARTLNLRRARPVVLAIYPGDVVRPKTRGDCRDGPRPCPFVSCRHHLALDVKPNGNLTDCHPGRELEALADTCVLDVAERGPRSLEETGRALNLGRERVRQIQLAALMKLMPERLARELASALDAVDDPHEVDAAAEDLDDRLELAMVAALDDDMKGD